MIRKVAYTLYTIVDVARARSFYEEVLGLEVGKAASHGDVHWIEYDLPEGGCLALSNEMGGAPGVDGGTIALEVQDLDALVEKLRAHSVGLQGDIIHGPKCRVAVCLDPDGNSLFLHEFVRGKG